jgi:hypothetical protein
MHVMHELARTHLGELAALRESGFAHVELLRDEGGMALYTAD